MSYSRSCGVFSVSNSSRYDMPEHPPPRTPTRRNTSSPRFCAPFRAFTCFFAFSLSASAMPRSPPLSSLRLGGRPGGGRRVLFLEVGQGRLDGVLRQHGAVDLHGGQLQLIHDVR